MKDKGHEPPAGEKERLLSELMEAAGKGDAGKVRSLLAAGADPLGAGESDMTALMAAARGCGLASSDQEGCAECVAILAPVSDCMARNGIQATALMIAAGAGNAKAVQELLPRSDPLAVGGEDFNALMWAARRGRLSCVELLAAQGGAAAQCSSHSTALIMAVAACANESWECAQWLSHCEGALLSGAGGWTALMHAAAGGGGRRSQGREEDSSKRLAMVKRLAELGGLDAVNKSGETALALAADEGMMDSVAALLAAGANARIATKRGVTPLMWAAESGRMGSVELLLPASDVSAVNEKGMSAADGAEDKGHADVAALIRTWMEAQEVAEAAGPGKASAVGCRRM